MTNETRANVLGYLDAATEPVGVEELAEQFGLHHTSIRAHLARLVAAGLAEAATESARHVGRPRLVYRATPRGHALLHRGPDPYEQLTVMLTDVISGHATPREVGRAQGRRAALSDPQPGADGVVALARELDRHGFRARVDTTTRGTRIVLGACPFATAAQHDPTTICELHLGYAEGVAEAIGGVVITGLTPHDPSDAGCELSVETGALESGDHA
ncbi:MAG: helix-turn-helix transcriptional regulator [Acidimicrobiia bacterium]